MYKIFSIIAFAFFIFILWIIYLANTGEAEIIEIKMPSTELK